MSVQPLVDLVEFTAKLLITTPEAQPHIKAIVLQNEGPTVTVELHVPEIERGKVIGRQGRTAEAIRVLLNAAANRLNKRASLQIAENQDHR